LHDAITAERHGVPAIAVMTTRFESAADLMAKVLGMPGYPYVTIGHPVSSASDAELRRMAEHTVAEARRLLLRG
jgi:hypothetical protein